MSSHEYTPEQALATLMRILRERDPMLAETVQAAIDAGQDVSEREPSLPGRKKVRVYRKTVPLSFEEALQVALKTLEACFIEQPMFVNSYTDSLLQAAVGVAGNRGYRWLESGDATTEREGQRKTVLIELRTETQISRRDQETLELRTVSPREIQHQRQNLSELSSLLTFQEESDGNAKRS